MSHVPLHPDSCDGVAMIWDFPAVIKALGEAPKGSVLAVLCGHDHHGGYVFDPVSLTHHITFKSPLNLGTDGDCFGLIDVIPSSSSSSSSSELLEVKGEVNKDCGSLVIRGPNLKHFVHRKMLQATVRDVKGHKSFIYHENGDECIRLPFNQKVK
jgi:hypothetical protein